LPASVSITGPPRRWRACGEVGERRKALRSGVTERTGRAEGTVAEALGNLLQEPLLIELLGSSEEGLPGGGEQVYRAGGLTAPC
jgi:hypothetical protein